MENINIKDILRNAPANVKLYSPIIGECNLSELQDEEILVFDENHKYHTFDTEGKYKFDNSDLVGIITTEECMLFPSKDTRDWSNVQYRPKFNFESFKPFDKVLARDYKSDYWLPTVFSMYENNNPVNHYIMIDNRIYNFCIPYNDETKHIAGTDQMPPYVYQEL